MNWYWSETHRRLLYALAHKVKLDSGFRGQIEELVYEGWWRQAKNYENPLVVSHWIRRKMFAYACKYNSEQRDSKGVDVVEVIDGKFWEERERESDMDVSKLLGYMTELGRLYVIKYFWKEMTYTEIADEFGVTKQTVRQTVLRALKLAKDTYEREQIPEDSD